MTKGRILIVEDEAIVARDIQNRLQALGYEVPAVAHTGEHAILRAQELSPDLILMDIRLKGEMDGVEAAELIRRRHDIPVIYLTAYSDETTLARAKITSPSGYIIKPFEDRDLQITLEIALYRHQTQKQLAASERKFRNIFEKANDAIIYLDAQGTIVDVNYALETIFGYKREEVMGQDASQIGLLAPEMITDVIDLYEDSRARGLMNLEAYQINHKNGNIVFVEASFSLVEHDDGQKGMLVLLRDVTDRQRAEEVIRSQNRQLAARNQTLRELHAIINKSPAVAFLWENRKGWPVEFVTDNVANLFGYTAEEFRSGTIRYIDIVAPHDLDRVALEADRYSNMQGEDDFSHLPYRITTRNGEVKWVENITHVRRDDAGKITHFEGIVVDITERKQAEQRLLESEERFRETSDLLQQGIVEMDTQGEVTYANRKTLDIFGCSGAVVKNTLIPEDRTRARAYIRRRLQGESIREVEFKVTRPDGTIFPITVHSSPIWHGNRISGLRSVVMDITDRKQAEQERARVENLEELNRLKTLLLASVSHELRTPLTCIKGLASSLIQPDVSWDPPTQKEFLQGIDEAADRLTHIVTDLIDMSQLEAGTLRMEKGPSKLSTILNQIHRQLVAVTSKHHFEMRVDPDLPPLYCDEVRIGQVISNLVANASAYSEEGTAILLEARQVGSDIQVRVTDHGMGIPADKLDDVFDRFQRLEKSARRRKEGAGLGLAISKGIIENHQGRIWAESEKDKGSRFTIMLPLIDQAETVPPNDAGMTCGCEAQ